MDPKRWEEIERVFSEAVEMDASARAALLERLSADDVELAREVSSLLAHHEDEGTLFEAPAAALRDLSAGRAGTGLEGQRIGRYRIVREIGAGGMGRVFLAERDDLPKRVALKLVREPLASPDRGRRFALEQRLLARLEHPHIAQLVDAGVTEGDSPYLAMEYVEGRPITEYCDAKTLGLDERLQLFLQVCDAVRYAHGHLVVHRDIKPSNILITPDGRAKLLDFGVAKLLSPEPGDGPELTRTSTRVFTPSYAAPEQVTGEPVSTATDVYQLGALLYEVIAGRPPLDSTTTSPTAVARAVLEHDPPPPSSILTRATPERTRQSSGPTTVEVALLRSSTPTQLRKRIRGDLDNIVLTALEKRPERRYASVEALAADVQRHLDGQPVTVRKGTVPYRLRKFVGRNKVAVAGVLLVIGYALTATVAGAGIARERDRAQREAQTASRVSDFLVDVFTAADPNDTTPGQATALDLVARGAERVDEQLEQDPAVQAAMQEALARVYHGLGRYDEAEGLFRSSLATRADVFGTESLEVASARSGLSQVLWAKGDLAGADSLGQQVLAVRRELLDESDPALWEVLNDLGTVRHLEGNLDEAERLLREVVGLVRRTSPEGHTLLGMYLSNLANVLFAKGEYADATRMMEQALESDRLYLPADHPSIAIRLDNLAYMALRAGEHAEALERADEALAMYWRVYGAEHPDMPYAMTTIASASAALGDTARADSMFTAALELREFLGGPDNPDLFMSHRDLGRHLLETGRPQPAEPHFEEALRLARISRGEEHEWFASALWDLGRAREELGDTDAAVGLMQQGFEIHRDALGPDHPVVAEEAEHLVALLRRLGRTEAAARIEGGS